MKLIVKLLCLALSLFLLLSCTPVEGTIVQVSRDRYMPSMILPDLSVYRGQTMIFDSIVVESKDIHNFYYFSPDREIGYVLFYTPQHMQQPIASFYWYALQKAFLNAGIKVKEGGPLKNVPQLHIAINSLTDQDAELTVSLSRNGVLLVQKNIKVSMPMPPTKDVKELEKRSYLFLDKIVVTSLTDPDIKQEFFSEKARIS